MYMKAWTAIYIVCLRNSFIHVSPLPHPLQRNSPFQSRVGLDNNIDHDNEAYLQRRRYAIDNFARGGVEVAPTPYFRPDMDASTISGSYRYGSRNSIEMRGYMSSSQAPDTNSYYESSDYRVCCWCPLLFVYCLLFTVYVVLHVPRTRMEVVSIHRLGTDYLCHHLWGKSLW